MGDCKTYIIKGKGAYSDVQAVYPGDRLAVSDSELGASDGQSGSVFDLSTLLDEPARICCTPEMDVYFEGDYGLDRVNLWVDTGIIREIAEFFGDTDIACYDFIGTPKFARKVTVTIGADQGSTLYQYNRKTGDLTRMSADYDGDSWSFDTKSLGTYIIAEEGDSGDNLEE